MPGTIASLAVTQGQSVKAGQLLLVVEAMKMETAIMCPRDAFIGELCIHAGQTVNAKELLLVLDSVTAQ